MDWFLYDMDLHHERVNEWCQLKVQTYLNKPAMFIYLKDDVILCVRRIGKKYTIVNRLLFWFLFSFC